MTPIIVILLLFSYLLIATTHLTGVNKAAISIFLAAIGWVVYISWGTDFIMDLHSVAYAEYLGDNAATSDTVKNFIYDSVFLKYVGKAAAIVMYLLATMSIIEILNTNGCFDFINEWIRTRNPNRLLWTITLATFILSANLDNLTTTIVMLVIMHSTVRSRAQRMLIGSAIVLAAVCGGCAAPGALAARLAIAENAILVRNTLHHAIGMHMHFVFVAIDPVVLIVVVIADVGVAAKRVGVKAGVDAGEMGGKVRVCVQRHSGVVAAGQVRDAGFRPVENVAGDIVAELLCVFFTAAFRDDDEFQIGVG